MKRTFLLIIVGAVLGGGAVFWKMHGGAGDKAAAAPAEPDKPEGAKISRDDKGLVLITMDDEMQGNIGLTVSKPAAAQWSPELKGYGHVLDPAPLAALLTELETARAATVTSSNELVRLKILAEQGNTSARALQEGQAAAQRDQLAFQSARDRLILGWGRTLTDRTDLATLIQSLSIQDAALVRVDLPAGELPASPPLGARLVALSGNSGEAEFIGAAPAVDPQMQGRGYVFLARTNALQLFPGEAVTAYLKLPGDPVNGVDLPRDSIVRTEGAGWVYILNEGADSFTRFPVPLDRPLPDGWFISQGVTTNNNIVVVGAQTLLSEELKASIKPD